MHINALWNLSQTQYPKLAMTLESAKKLLLKFDTGLHDIQIKRTEDNQVDIQAFHKTEQGEILSWKFEEESTGTQYLFSLACRIQLMFNGKHLIIVDELGSSIHPNIIREIVKLFQNPKTNHNQTQLIFTSHDTAY
jgi:hypothetical protein